MSSTLKAKVYALAVMSVLMLGIAPAASAGPFEDGVAAYGRKDYATTLRLFRPLANQGVAAAQFSLGWMYYNGHGVAQDYAEALKWYRLAANQGYVEAQSNLGLMYRDGKGVTQNYAEALKWFRLTANQGIAIAQFHLGLMYYNGHGVTQNYAEALRWFRLAANQGVAVAQFNLGWMYANGRGVPQDYAEALKWYRLAANQGYAEAQSNLGLMYDSGRGVPRDYAEALKWYRLAANQGYAEAQFNLGWMYANGRGVPQDFVEAHKWYRRADVGGIKNAAKARSLVEGKMTLEQLAAAQRQAVADQPNTAWQQIELNEKFMRSLSKRDCMDKTVAMLKAGCNTATCLKPLAGILGDCVTWATGSITAFCNTYDQDYIRRYCVSNELDARGCVLLYESKSVLCERETKP